VTSTIDHLSNSISGPASAHVDATLIVLLLVLLAEQELVRAYLGDAATARLRPLWIVLAPLLAAFVLIVLVRMLGLR
jgi:hypothetical protein